jgi:hypothetical protein
MIFMPMVCTSHDYVAKTQSQKSSCSRIKSYIPYTNRKG